MFIDIHVHTRKRPGPPRLDGRQAYATPEYLIERYDKLGIEKAVCLVLVRMQHYPTINQEIQEICEEYPDRFIPFCNVDPASDQFSRQPLGSPLRYYKEQGFKGIGEVTTTCPSQIHLCRTCSNM